MQEGTMGLLDVINGMQQGPRGPSTPSPESEQSESGMSPMTMAILALLAWKAVKHFSGTDQTGTAPQPTPQANPQRTPQSTPAESEATGTDIGGMLKGALGGLLAGGAAGSVLSGGLNDLMKQLQQGGQGEVAKSWVGNGPNKAISPKDLGSALGADQIDQLSSQSGLSRDSLLDGLSRFLPQVVDHLTPEGRLPSDNEVSRRL
jgi:uncharacterized protein YidB (DUF937 family)